MKSERKNRLWSMAEMQPQSQKQPNIAGPVDPSAFQPTPINVKLYPQ